MATSAVASGVLDKQKLTEIFVSRFRPVTEP